MPWIIGGSAVVGALLGSSSASKGAAASERMARETNQVNIRLAAENRDFLANMADTSVSRRMADLRNAGLNPMPSYMQQAAVPQTTAARIDNPGESYADAGRAKAQAYSSAAQIVSSAKIQAAQIQSINADTAVKMANAQLTEQQVEKAKYETAITANTASQLGVTNAQQHYALEKTRKEIENIISGTQLNDLTREQMHKLMPAVIEYKQAEAKLKGLELPAAKAEADFYDTTKDTSQFVRMIKDIITGVRATGAIK
ncbi:VP2 [Kummerowia striata gokushovirus]|nr:VP2 [Kummerowia striata gokushovirus]